MQALISTQKNTEHGIHYKSESRQEKMACNVLTSVQLYSHPCLIYILKWNPYLYFLIKQKLLISVEKMLISQNLRGVSHDLHIFWIFIR